MSRPPRVTMYSVGLRQWSRELDERFGPSPKPPLPWSPDMGALMSARKWLEGLASGSAILGLAMLVAALVTRKSLVSVAIGTLMVGAMSGGSCRRSTGRC